MYFWINLSYNYLWKQGSNSYINNMKQIESYAFIDGQNLFQWVSRPIDYRRFRIYLREKYSITKAYYFLWFQERENNLYERLQDAGFILIFNLKWENLKSNKKWNVDTNIVFQVMKKLMEGDTHSVVLISGDGDYKMLVDYLIEKNKLTKVLVPNLKFASSLYRRKQNLESAYFDYIDKPWVQQKIGFIKKAP